MKRFMYFSISVLCLALAAYVFSATPEATVGPREVIAQTVDPASDIVAMDGTFALDRFGQVWNTVGGEGGCWNRAPSADPPEPVSDMVRWQFQHVLTKSGDVWGYAPGLGRWVNCGPWPGGEVPSSQETWGGVKGKYEGEK